MSNEGSVGLYADNSIIYNPTLFSGLLIYTPNCLSHISIQLRRHLKFTMSKQDFTLFPQSLRSLEPAPPLSPLLKRRKLGVILISVTPLIPLLHLQILAYLPLKYICTCSLLSISIVATLFQTTKISFLDAVICSYLVYLFPFLPPCCPFFYRQEWSS